MTSRTLFAFFLALVVTIPSSKQRVASAQTTSGQPSHEEAAAADKDKKQEEKQAEILRLKAFHYEVVDSLRNGKGLDETVSKQKVSKLASDAGYSARTTSRESMYFRNTLAENPDQLKYRDALKAAEEAMVLMQAEK